MKSLVLLTVRVSIALFFLFFLFITHVLALGQGNNFEENEVPRFIVEEVRELIRYVRPEFSQKQLASQVKAFCKGVVYIRDLDAFLDARGVCDKERRKEIHKK